MSFDAANIPVNFEFNSPDFESTMFHDLRLETNSALGVNQIEKHVLSYAEAVGPNDDFIDFGHAEKAPSEKAFDENGNYKGLPVNIYDKGGNLIGCAYAEPYVPDEHRDELMPDGNKASDMERYTWDDFEALEKAAVEVSDFVDAVESISGPEGPAM